MRLIRGFSNKRALAVRIALITLGCLAVSWGIFVFPVFLRTQILSTTAAQITRGDRFSTNALNDLLATVNAAELDRPCNPASRHSAAVIRLRLAEDSLNSPFASNYLYELRLSMLRSLSCAPADPFLWFALFWTVTREDGFRPETIKYLAMSYRLGPNEGWIIARRNSIALSVFDKLPPDLANDVADEFTKIVGYGMSQYAAQLFTGPGWPVHDVLLRHLATSTVSPDQRKAFANSLDALGYDIDIPGVPVKRGWR
jgi:hypothetical protein